MKCVVHNPTGKISRLPDKIAQELVSKGNHHFISKNTWKAAKAKGSMYRKQFQSYEGEVK